MVVYERDRADDFAVGALARRFDELVANEIAEGLRTIRVSAPFDKVVEFPQQVGIDGHADAAQLAHSSKDFKISSLEQWSGPDAAPRRLRWQRRGDDEGARRAARDTLFEIVLPWESNLSRCIFLMDSCRLRSGRPWTSRPCRLSPSPPERPAPRSTIPASRCWGRLERLCSPRRW